MHGTVSRARRRGPTGTRPLRRRRGRVCTKPYARPWFRWIPDPDRVATTRTAGAPVRRRLGRDYPRSMHGTVSRARRRGPTVTRGPSSSPRPRVHETVRSAVVSLDTRPGPGAYDSHGWGGRPTPIGEIIPGRCTAQFHGHGAAVRPARGPSVVAAAACARNVRSAVVSLIPDRTEWLRLARLGRPSDAD
ncbi:unnamed protein product [Macrosiphum euphorbiae]|uniref:Uncharacterized protein n=1 Tax=Macrosiphum euphorbiae TaxID=13131 RepID=A0AAV0Y270_9HEMI|nr:unnamed protein product [Macrosiphum euphorbiae]